jgi:hypothetical protein
MKKLVNQLLSFINEDAAAMQAKKAGYLSLGGGYYSKTGEAPATATTRGGTFRLLTKKEREARARFPLPGRSTMGYSAREGPPRTRGTEADVVTQVAKDSASDSRTDKLFAYLSRPSSRISRMMALSAFETTISDRLTSDQQERANLLKSGIESLLEAHAKGQTKLATDLAKELHKEFKFYSNTSGTSFKTQAFGMAERHFLGKTALARDLVKIFEDAGIDIKGAEDQDRAFKKTLSGSSKPDLGEKFYAENSTRVKQILSGFSQVPDMFKQLFGPRGKDGDLLDNSGGKNSRVYFEHSINNNNALEKTEKLLRSRGMNSMADSMSKHRQRMLQIAKNWDKYSSKEREQAVGDSYASMAVELNSTKLGGDSELCGAIMKNLAEVNLYDQELAGGKEVYMPSHGSFPAADKLVRVKAGTKAERIDKISVKYGKTGKIYGMPAQSSTICLLHPDSYYHKLTGGKVGLPGYETGVRSDVVLTDKGWERMMKESGYSKYIPQKQQKQLLAQYKKLQSVIEQERNSLKRKNIKDIVLMMKSNPKIEQERKKLGELTNQVADTLEQHVGPNNASVMRNQPMSFASLMTTHASIRTAKGFPDLLHCHQELEMNKFNMGIDEGDDELRHWFPLWREVDERGGGLLIGFSKE